MNSVEPDRAPEPPGLLQAQVVKTTSAAPLERVLNLQVCQIYNLGDIPVCVQGNVKLHGQAGMWVDCSV